MGSPATRRCHNQSVFFPFYQNAMTFEEFIPAFNHWFAREKGMVAAILTGVRADESLNRFMGLVSGRKLRYAEDKPWTTASAEGFYYTMYPLYDWKTRDVWIYHARTRAAYNSLYDLMYRAGFLFAICGCVSLLDRSNVRGCGFIMYWSRIHGAECVLAYQVL